jgi:peptidoglycan-N-acetylglucosamine deacetylase
LKFNRYIFFLILIAIIIVATGSSPLFLIIPLLLFIAITAFGSFNMSSKMFVDAICSNDSFPEGLLLTFDDGPHAENTIEILDILDKNKVKALFFVIGENVVNNPQILEEVNSRGHSIGIHTYSHSSFFGFYPENKIIDEIKSTKNIISQITGKPPIFFRPPFGVTNPPIAKSVKKMGCVTVGWSVRSFDTKIKKGDEILEKTLKKLKGGDIVLFHDTVKGTVEMLDSFISKSREKGYSFIVPEKFLPED